MFILSLLVSIFGNSFSNVLKRGIWDEFVATIKHTAIVCILAIVYMYLQHTASIFSRLTFLYIGIFYTFFSFAVRLLWKRHLHRKMSEGGTRSLLIITTRSRLKSVKQNVIERNYEMYSFKGIALVNLAGDSEGKRENARNFQMGPNEVPIVADQDSVISFLMDNPIDEVLFDFPGQLQNETVRKLIDTVLSMGIITHIQLEAFKSMNARYQSVGKIGSYMVYTAAMGEASTLQLCVKRLMDIIGGIIGCAITGVLAVVIGPIIYRKSPGASIFFHQTRIGRNGKKFEMYKFRSMYPDAEERKKSLMKENRIQDGMMFKLEYDPRIIGCYKDENGTIHKGIGNFIRDKSIDEFPQFWNVLKGDMSMVGTRPPTVDEWEKYEPYHRSRMSCKPGITGLWQVSGRSEITDFEEVVRLDREYIEHWNIGMDVKILCKTVKVVLTGRGAM